MSRPNPNQGLIGLPSLQPVELNVDFALPSELNSGAAALALPSTSSQTIPAKYRRPFYLSGRRPSKEGRKNTKGKNIPKNKI